MLRFLRATAMRRYESHIAVWRDLFFGARLGRRGRIHPNRPEYFRRVMRGCIHVQDQPRYNFAKS